MNATKGTGISMQHQSGAVLIIALLLLMVLTLLALTSSNVGMVQERMSANTSEYNLAFQRAEAVVREVEFRLSRPVSGLDNVVEWGSIAGLRSLPSDCALETNFGSDWNNLGNGLSWAAAPNGQGEYVVIELTEFFDNNNMRRISCRLEDGLTSETGAPIVGEHYLILARAFGEGDTEQRARVIVQSIFWWPR